jgi:hypothetical protein
MPAQPNCEHNWCLIKLIRATEVLCLIHCSKCKGNETRSLTAEEYQQFMANAWREYKQ